MNRLDLLQTTPDDLMMPFGTLPAPDVAEMCGDIGTEQPRDLAREIPGLAR